MSEVLDRLDLLERIDRTALRPRIQVPARRGPYQDNGASPWYSPVRIGSGPDAPELKLNIDTGARFNWLTSNECTSEACLMPTRSRFDPAASPSFRSEGQEPVRIDFGYWGAMHARAGSDVISFGDGALPPQRAGFYCTTHYDGQQFRELNWDGGLGIPNGLSPDPNSTHLIEALLNAGLLAPEQAMVSFTMDPASGSGSVEIGGYDEAAVDPASCIELPFKPYKAGLDYIWTTPLRSFHVGHAEIARDRFFCHDTGSSHFKGDPAMLTEALRQVALQGRPDLELGIGHRRSDGLPARLVLTPDEYVCEIEAGHGAGGESVNLHPLAGYDSLLLVGSILMDHVCTVYRFKVIGRPGQYRVAPGTTLMFNKRGGPRVIRS